MFHLIVIAAAAIYILKTIDEAADKHNRRKLREMVERWKGER